MGLDGVRTPTSLAHYLSSIGVGLLWRLHLGGACRWSAFEKGAADSHIQPRLSPTAKVTKFEVVFHNAKRMGTGSIGFLEVAVTHDFFFISPAKRDMDRLGCNMEAHGRAFLEYQGTYLCVVKPNIVICSSANIWISRVLGSDRIALYSSVPYLGVKIQSCRLSSKTAVG